MLTPLFDRFEGRRAAGGSFVRDLEDLLGARRTATSPGEGVVGWGVPIPPGLSPVVESHRECVANLVAQAIARFEPRLHEVRVTPVEAAGEFLFDLEAKTWPEERRAIRLRVLVPRRDGGLGARVLDVDGVAPCPGGRASVPAAAGGSGPGSGSEERWEQIPEGR